MLRLETAAADTLGMNPHVVRPQYRGPTRRRVTTRARLRIQGPLKPGVRKAEDSFQTC